MSKEKNKLIRAEFRRMLDKLIDSKIRPTATEIISVEQPLISLFEEVMYKLERQQKEIEERDKYNVTTLPFKKIKADIEQNKNIFIFGKEYISKDKIREIFQFYIERDSLFNDDPHKMAVIRLKDVLQELLEENNAK